jgi:hypothetical protein
MELSYKHIDAGYYISRVLIPPLERIFNLVGADARRWYDDMPKSIRIQPDSFSPTKIKPDTGVPNRPNIDKHFRSSQCLICGALASDGDLFCSSVLLIILRLLTTSPRDMRRLLSQSPDHNDRPLIPDPSQREKFYGCPTNLCILHWFDTS